MSTKELKILKISDEVKDEFQKISVKSRQITSSEIRSAQQESRVNMQYFFKRKQA